MKDPKSIQDLGPIQLWKLRKEICLNSYFLKDYENSYGLDPKEVYDFFMGFLDWIEEAIKDDNPGISSYDLDNMWDVYLEDYDTPSNLRSWWLEYSSN